MKRRIEASYLERPYWKATLGEHRAANEDPVHRELHSFLGADPSLVDRHASQHPVYDLPHLHHAIAACFPEWRLELEIGHERRRGIGGATRVRREVAPDKWGEFVDNGYLLYRVPDGGARIVAFDGPFNEGRGDVYDMTVMSRRTDRRRVDLELTALHKWLRENHYLKGKAIRPNGSLLPRSSVKSWDEMSLPTSVLEAILQNTVVLLGRREIFVRHGVPQKRGVLLHGPPGTGKTMVGKILASLGVATFVYATAADCESLPSMRHLFELGRRLRPTILFLEDLDLFASDRNSQFRPGPLGELLTQMDGLEENDGLIVVATTNDLEAIEPALKDRPSRFDSVLEIGLPEAAERRRIVELNLPNSELSAATLDRIADATDGFSGAQVRELAFLAMQESLLRSDTEDSSFLSVADVDIERARQRIIGARNRDAKVGFAYREPQQESCRESASSSSCEPF